MIYRLLPNINVISTGLISLDTLKKASISALSFRLFAVTNIHSIKQIYIKNRILEARWMVTQRFQDCTGLSWSKDREVMSVSKKV